MQIIEDSATQSSPETRAGRRLTLVTLAVVAAVFAWLFVGYLLWARSYTDLIDLLVYRAGGHAVLHGHSIYAADFAAANQSPNGLSFTYPPFAAVVFVPLAIVPVGVAKTLMLLFNTSAALLLFTLIVVATQGNWDRLRSRHALTGAVSVKTAVVLVIAAIVFTLSVPVEHNMTYGQVNLLLAAAVALDILPPRVPWPRGLLVGIAVAIKLTPAVFVGYFLVTRAWRPLVVSVVTTVLAVLVGWLVLPADTVRYLTSTAFDPARIGGLAYSSNQSVRGILERLPKLDSVHGAVWMVATVLVLALAVTAIEVNRRRGDTVAALLSAAFIGLLCSPVSWGHHWVWLPAAAVYFLVRWAAVGAASDVVAGVLVAGISLWAPWAHLPNSDDRERLWSAGQHLLGSVWGMTALVLLVLFAVRARKPVPEMKA
ncbi:MULTISPECIES: glycosyltransferase 87 family protein [Mycobacterium]|uniref:glycosyltransferase 87 family protein n=1 Tax=Mycobacterium TaxID=1763 RepID=UPI001EEFB64D|nr:MULTISPECIES: glycosyltransferase 87 family protein [Mycobacterium]BDB45239.1 hypothetical protein IWGMT90018_56850 [Mycobacterium kiyosense]BDE16712.1 hypothetical protein MKCMC460_55720 [Mycobacterium sp. 20KCMC460]GLB90469.1 hypothetical protein SRL2020130_32860 [Mycobacterium kiyosense]GLC02989.1 hypothetical protein SRL2020400_35800 [Mycobacterium kiyosense]GLC08453.1 hypothetical protein SRL2020411_30990 [Mycobacterium kiyosense]